MVFLGTSSQCTHLFPYVHSHVMGENPMVFSETRGRGRLRRPGGFGELPGRVRSLGEGPAVWAGVGNFGVGKMVGKWLENDALMWF